MVGSLDQDVRHGLLVGLPYTLVERARNGGAQPNPEDAAYARQSEAWRYTGPGQRKRRQCTGDK
jgi:hypothetical protein